MAEDKQNDLSMEDILSSIKDILSNDSQDDGVLKPALANSETETTQNAEGSNLEDDVFDLSADMMIDDKEFESLNLEAESINLDFDENPVEGAPSELKNEKEIPDIDISALSAIVEEDAPQTMDETSDTDVPYTEDIIETVAEILPEPEEENIDSLPEPEIPVQEDSVSDRIDDKEEAIAADIITDVDAEPIFSVEDEREHIGTDVSAIEELMDNQAIRNRENDNKTENKAEEIQSGEIDQVLSAASELIEADATEDTSAVDASASIISNFAKMFAAKSDKKSEEKENAAPVVPLAPIAADDDLGNVSKTLEDIIKDTIKQMIGAAVMAKFAENTDINRYAQEEIKVQTKAWLDKNLPAVVEAAVQKEIERVMAKVGK